MVNVIRNLPGQIWTWLLKTIQNVISWGSDMVSRGRQAALDLFNAIVNKVREIPGQMFSIGSNIVSGIWNGISNSIGWITNKVKEFAGSILNGIKSALGIHSPSVEFYKVGDFSMVGWFNGIQNGVSKLLELIKSIGNSILDAVKGIDFGKVLAVGLGAGLLYVTNNVTKAVTSFSKAIESVAAPAKGLGKLL